MATPIRQMMGQNVIARGNIDNPNTRLKAFGDDPRLDIIRPTPLAPPPRLDNLASAHKPIATIRHPKPPPDLGRLLAGASRVRNIANQWGGAAAYGEVDFHKVAQMERMAARCGKSGVGFTTTYRTWKDAAARQSAHGNIAVQTYIWIQSDPAKHLKVEG